MTTTDASANGGTSPPSPRVTVQFDRPGRVYEPQLHLGVRYAIDGVDPKRVRAVERSALWYTEGKGEEDLGIHFFERIEAADKLPSAVPIGSFAVQLPTSPLSYEGVIVKVRWCIRVRLFFTGGRDFVSEHVFDVGRLPPARGPVERIS